MFLFCVIYRCGLSEMIIVTRQEEKKAITVNYNARGGIMSVKSSLFMYWNNYSFSRNHRFQMENLYFAENNITDLSKRLESVLFEQTDKFQDIKSQPPLLLLSYDVEYNLIILFVSRTLGGIFKIRGKHDLKGNRWESDYWSALWCLWGTLRWLTSHSVGIHKERRALALL